MSSIENFFTKKPAIQFKTGDVASSLPAAAFTRSRAIQKTTQPPTRHTQVIVPDHKNIQRFPTVLMEEENMRLSSQQIHVTRNKQVPPNRCISTQPRVVIHNIAQKPGCQPVYGYDVERDRISVSNNSLSYEITTDKGMLIIYQC